MSIAIDNYLNRIKDEILANQNLCKYLLLDYDNPLAESDITDTSILYTDKDNQRLFFVPFTLDSSDVQKTTLTVVVNNFDLDNNTKYYKTITLDFIIACHRLLWVLDDNTGQIKLRVNGIWNEIEKTFNNKSNIVGLGRTVFDYAKIVQFNESFWGYRYCLTIKDFPALKSLGGV